MAMCVHVGAQQRVHSGLIAATLRAKPLNNIGVNTERKQSFPTRLG